MESGGGGGEGGGAGNMSLFHVSITHRVNKNAALFFFWHIFVRSKNTL